MRSTTNVTTKRAHRAPHVAPRTQQQAIDALDEGASQMSADNRTERVRQAAYALYEQRGCGDGHDFDDWLMAESLVDRELAGSHGEDAPAGRPE